MEPESEGWTGDNHQLLLTVFGAGVSADCTRYSVQTIYLACPGWVVQPRSLNAQGDVAGSYFCGGYDRACATWNGNSAMSPLQMPPGTYFSIAYGVNASGQMAERWRARDRTGVRLFYIMLDGHLI